MRDCIHVDQHKTRNIYWNDILEKVHKNEDNDPAKYALVVDLARLPELINPVDRITEKPKRVLRRIHDQERIQKVKEIDIKCIRSGKKTWLCFSREGRAKTAHTGN